MEKFHKFTQYNQFCLLQGISCLDWTIYSWQGFNLLGCILMLRINYWCVQSINISVDVAKCVEKFHKFTQYSHFLSVTNNDLSWVNYLFMARFQHISISFDDNNQLLMCSVTQHQCTRHQMCGKVSQIHPVTSLWSVTENDLSWLNNLLMARFEHISISSDDKNKL